MPQGASPLVVEAYTEAYNRNLQSMQRYIFNDPAREFDKISKVESTDRLTNERQAIQSVGLPVANRDLEALPEVAPVKGYKTTIRITSYRSAVFVEETMMRTAVFKEPLDNARDMMRSTNTLKDITAANFFNNGTTAGLGTNITEADGTARAAFATDHYYENGSSTFSNYYNVGVPPTPEVVYLIINSYLRRLKDFGATNFVSYGNQFTIVTPTLNPNYGLAADELIQSVDRPDTANRATNVLKNVRLNHVALNQLTSSTAWYMIIPTSDASFPLRTLEMIPYEISPLAPISGNPDAFFTRNRTQFGVGWDKTYRGIVRISA